jgi:hypothetical protein
MSLLDAYPRLGESDEIQRIRGKRCALHIEAARKAPSNIMLDLVAKFGVDVRDGSGKTPLFYAYTIDKMRMLIKNGANVNCLDIYGRNVLFYARDADMVKFLVDEAKIDADIIDDVGHYMSGTALHYAVYQDAPSEFITALARSIKNIDIYNPNGSHKPDGHGGLAPGCIYTPLCLARSARVVKILLDFGANPNRCCGFYDNMYPLRSPAAICSSEVVNLLIERGASVDGPVETSAVGQAPHAYAGYTSVLNTLLSKNILNQSDRAVPILFPVAGQTAVAVPRPQFPLGITQRPAKIQKTRASDQSHPPLCIVCMNAIPTVVYLPCRHMCVCEKCKVEHHPTPENPMQKCYICRADVVQSVQAIFP